mgnify:FL=1
MTRNLEEGEYAVYDNELVGLNKADGDALQQLLEQEPNTRILGGSFGVMLYRIGNQFYDSSKVATKRTKVVDELNALQLDNEVQSNELSYKRKVENLKIKLEGLEKILEYGNALMRTGNPVVLLDSNLVEKSRKNMKGYLVNHGFFDAEVDFSITTKDKKASISYEIEENKPYILDSVYTRIDNSEIQGLISSFSSNSFLISGCDSK